MTFSIKQVDSPETLSLCHQLLGTVFHDELDFTGMEIPDQYDPFSVYMAIADEEEEVVGTYRIAFPNPDVGLPIEEVAFATEQFAPQKICEMSRLVLLKKYRGKIPFYKIIESACDVAAQNEASVLLAAIIPQNVRLFKRQGFMQVGEPIPDPSLGDGDAKDAVIHPMYKPV